MSTTRRGFLKATGTSLIATFSNVLPTFLQRIPAAVPKENANPDTALIVVQLSGGNDGLNTVVPYADDVYGRSRRTLRLTGRDVLKIDDYLGFHPRTGGLHRLYQEGRLTIVQGVGYPQASRNHDSAMRHWHTARPRNTVCDTGWIGRLVDQAASLSDAPTVPATFIGPIAPPFALNARANVVPAIRAATDLTLERQALLDTGPRSSENSLLALAANAAQAARKMSVRIDTALKHGQAGADYPPFPLARQFQTIATLLRAGVGIRVYFTEIGGGGIGGFDNHANQRDNHAALLHELSESIAALAADLAQDQTLDRVLLMTFSEFGRTVSENGRRGTGHGEAAPMFLVGGRLRGGLCGKHPSLADLDQDGLKFHTDFRRVYATVLEQWLGYDSKPILGDRYPVLDVLQS